MKKIGIFGTCRIDNYEILDFKKNNNTYPFIFSNGNYSIFIRPLGYTTTTSDIFQNLNLIKNNIHKEIKDEFIIKNVFKKHGGKTFITDIDYDYLVLEICSLKKIIHLETNYIFPYEIEEDKFDNKKYKIETESFDETVQNIIKIRELINCPIILLPPIIKFEGNVIKGIHENNDKVMEYRNEIINRLKKASDNENIFLFDWNKIIDEKGIKYMLLDQFHFTIHGKKIISEQIFNIIKSKKVYFNNEKVNINLPHDIDNRHRYYKMFEQRDNCEINFRLLINYLYEKKILDYNKNIIDLGAWIGDNAIPWSFKINGNIYAIDPSLDNINFIKELIYLNNIHNIICINKCISDKIEDVFASGDLKHTSFNNETGNIAFRATFPNPKGILRHGGTGNILMPINLKNAIIIPQRATFDVLDKKYVYVVDNNKVLKARQIIIAQELPHLYVLASGLNANDKILAEGLGKVKNNVKIDYEFVSFAKELSELNNLHAE